MQQYIENHPEKNLLACVWFETADWLKSIASEDSVDSVKQEVRSDKVIVAVQTATKM